MSIPSDDASTQRHEYLPYLPDDRELLKAAQKELERTRRGLAASKERIKPAASLIEAAVSASTKPSRRRRSTAPTPPARRPPLEQLAAWLPECPHDLLARVRAELRAFVMEIKETEGVIDQALAGAEIAYATDLDRHRSVVSVEMPSPVSGNLPSVGIPCGRGAGDSAPAQAGAAGSDDRAPPEAD